MDNDLVRVFLVDDDEDDYVIIRDLLSESDGVKFDLDWVATYDGALEKIEHNEHDVYLLDYRLGKRNGLELLREALAKGCTAPIILLTGKGDYEVDIEAMKAGAADYLEKSKLGALLLERSLRYAIERKQSEESLRQQTERERLVAEIALHIRQSLNLEEVLRTTVSEVRQLLHADRVFIYRFEKTDWSGVVAVESVAPGQNPILGMKIADSFFAEIANRKLYRQGQIQATEDIYTADLSKCYIDLLNRLEIRANLVVPIVEDHHLWGLLVANQCSKPRQWQELEINLLQQLATQVAISIQQSTLFEQVQTELNERKQAEQKVREQAALLDIATDAILVRDLENQILFWNKGAECLYGWKTEEALGKKVDELLFAEISSQLEEAEKTVALKGEWQGELHQVTKDSKEIEVESRWTLVRHNGDLPRSILVVNTDITEKKQLEAQFLRAQRLESIGNLASGIAHDLNNILTPILAAAQLLPLKLPDVDERSQELFKILETNAKRGADLVKQVLSFARGVEGKRTTLQIKHLIWEIKQIAKETFPKSIEVYIDLSPDLWPLSGNATQLHQVMLNLCVNARDAMPDGGVLKISAKNLFVDENYARLNIDAQVGSYVVITVADTGTGIPPEIIERMFEPFFTTKEIGKGTGLGLATVVGIIKSHKGFVNVYSDVGEGTQFQVYLPAVVETTKTQQSEDLEPLKGYGELILVADDEAAIRAIVKTSLETHNYKVLTAKNGIEALALYEQHKDEIGAVLVDMMMPSMGGLTTIRRLKGIDPLVKVVAISGLTSSDQASAAMTTGVQAFLPKPFTSKELLQALHRVFNIAFL